MRILIVEDEDAIARPLATGLEREGFAVERVSTGRGALEATEPDVVLLDLRLPDMDRGVPRASGALSRADHHGDGEG